MKKRVISAAELAARWAYAELVSPRFANTYVPVAHPLRVKAMSGIAFDSLSTAEAEQLRLRLESHDDRRSMYTLLAFFPQFVHEAWEYKRLGNLSVAPGLGWSRFSNLEHGEALTSAAAELHVQLKATVRAPFIQSDGPIIVVPCRYKGRPFQLLLEGTFRSLLFARDRVGSMCLNVWVPTGGIVPELENGPSWV